MAAATDEIEIWVARGDISDKNYEVFSVRIETRIGLLLEKTGYISPHERLFGCTAAQAMVGPHKSDHDGVPADELLATAKVMDVKSKISSVAAEFLPAEGTLFINLGLPPAPAPGRACRLSCPSCCAPYLRERR